MKIKKMRKIGKKGQTAIEYILLLFVMTSLIASLLTMIKTNYLGNIANCGQVSERNKIMCKINIILMPSGGNKAFQYFPFKK